MRLKRHKTLECVVCEKRFKRGWNPKFDQHYGICEKCMQRLFDKKEGIPEEDLIGVFQDFV